MPGDDQLPSFDHALTISDFADQAVTLPLTVGTGLLLAASGWRRGAIAWTVAIGATLGLIVLLKLRFFACDGGNPSGHTAAAAAVYGGLAGLIAGAIRKDKHSVAEVVVGGVIGIAGAAGFVGFAGTPFAGIRIARIVAMSQVVVLLLHGVRLSAEETIKSMAPHFWPSSQCV
jgi:hypothetical protein